MKFFLGYEGEVTIIPVLKETTKVDREVELFNYIKEKEYFTGDKGELYTDISLNATNTIFVGLGEGSKVDQEVLRLAFFNVRKELEKYKVKTSRVFLDKLENVCCGKTVRSVVEGILQAEYKYDKFLTAEKGKKLYLESFSIDMDGLEEKREKLEHAIEETENLVEGIFLARDLVNEPAMYMTPTKLAQTAKDQLDPLGVDVEVFGREKIQSLKMEAFMAVAQGSDQEPKFIVMTYKEIQTLKKLLP